MPNALVIYSAHAMRRMQERGISQRLVEMTLAKPDRIFADAQGKPVAERAFNSGMVRVVNIDRLDPVGWHRQVITVMWK